MSFRGQVYPIAPALQRHMRGRSWRDDPRCPPFASLRQLVLRHWGLDGRVHWGELVVAERVVDDLLAIFERLYEAGFPIERMQRVDAFDGSDDVSMAANNSSAFNFRVVAGTDMLSHHALGVAVDLNPRLNPMFIAGTPHPPRGLINRDSRVPGVILRPGPVVDAFEARGWHWGGDWPDVCDTHHFSALPRGAQS